MKIKIIPPKEKLFQVWAVVDSEEDCIIVLADSKSHAEQIARQYWEENNCDSDIIFTIITQINLITEDK